MLFASSLNIYQDSYRWENELRLSPFPQCRKVLSYAHCLNKKFKLIPNMMIWFHRKPQAKNNLCCINNFLKPTQKVGWTLSKTKPKPKLGISSLMFTVYNVCNGITTFTWWLLNSSLVVWYLFKWVLWGTKVTTLLFIPSTGEVFPAIFIILSSFLLSTITVDVTGVNFFHSPS